MKHRLAPTYQVSIGDLWVLWYEVSNSYSVIDASFKCLLDLFLNASSQNEFNALILKEDNDADPLKISDTIHSYLSDCNMGITDIKNQTSILDPSFRNLSKHYKINEKVIKVNYDSELVLKTIHPSIAYATSTHCDSVDATFDIYLKNDILYLFKDNALVTSAPKLEYHKIQGKFIMHLLCTIHDRNESDWVSTFHGSTITDGNSSILIVGESGKGKSTLCALLTTYGFNLLADDVSPMLSLDQAIYYNPSAISIKEGAFKILESVIDNFKDLPTVNFNKSKGTLKYLPCLKPSQLNYPCNAVVLVNYLKDSKTSLKKASVKRLLETLIPDSWISSKPTHAKQFLDWLLSIKIYELTYSNTDEVADEISNLFKSFN